MFVRTVDVTDSVTVAIVEAPDVDLIEGGALPPTNTRFLFATISCDGESENSGKQGCPAHPEDDLKRVT